jgi:hypothetical protein
MKYYGSGANCADALGITRQAVHRWKESGVPIEQQIAVEISTHGDLRADLPRQIRTQNA